MSIIWGILCLGMIIFIHELGHFCAARICGVVVESFSIGMGPILLHKKIGQTDYRLSLIPLGGYCGMKGDKAFQSALDSGLDSIPKEEGAFYGVHPLKRMIIAFFGPFFNVLFAIFAFTIIAIVGYTYYSTDNRIILSDVMYPDMICQAKEAGLLTGDRIISLNGNETPYFSDISEYVSTHPGDKINTIVNRNGEQLKFILQPVLDKSTGAGKIGIMNWIEPVIVEVSPDSSAFNAGFQKGDIISTIDGQSVKNSVELQLLLENKTSCDVSVLRDGIYHQIKLILPNKGESVGLQFSIPEVKSKKFSFFPGIVQGVKETWKMFTITLKSLKLFFSGIDLSSAVSGPVRITVLLGDTVKYGFGQSFNTGFTSILNLLALISISLFIMNMLPIPILDGGLVMFALLEAITKKSLKPKVLYRFQIVGIVFIALLFCIALFSDLKFLWKR